MSPADRDISLVARHPARSIGVAWLRHVGVMAESQGPSEGSQVVLFMDTSDDHGDDTQGVHSHCSIQAALVVALEVSTWSARSAASTNDVDTDEGRQAMARRGLALERHHGERPARCHLARPSTPQRGHPG